MATTQELINKMKSYLSSFYNKLEENNIVVSGSKNLANLEFVAVETIEQAQSMGGAGVTELSTPEEMEAFKVASNVGKYAKYVGETTDTYSNNAIYHLKQEGGNIALFDESKKYEGEMYAVTYDYPLENNWSNGDSVNINFKIDGGEIQKFTSSVVVMEGMPLIGFDANTGEPAIIYQDENIAYMFAGYLTMNFLTGTSGQGYMAGYSPVSTTEVSTLEEIEAFKTEENIGKFISVTQTVGDYVADNVYRVMKEGDTIVIKSYEINLEIVSFEGLTNSLLPNPMVLEDRTTAINTSIPSLGLEVGKTYKIAGSYAIQSSDGGYTNDNNEFSIIAKARTYYDYIISTGEDFDEETLQLIQEQTNGVVCLNEIKIDVEYNGETGTNYIDIFDNAVDGGDLPNYNAGTCWFYMSVSGIAYVPFVINSIHELGEGENRLSEPIEVTEANHEIEGMSIFMAEFPTIGLQVGKNYKVACTYNGAQTEFNCSAISIEVADNTVALQPIDRVEPQLVIGNSAVVIYDKLRVEWTDTSPIPIASDDYGVIQVASADGTNPMSLPFSIDSITEIAVVEIPEEEREQVINPITQLYENPYVTLRQFPDFEIVTSKDIRQPKIGYNNKGEWVQGSLTNPEIIRTQEELDEVLNSDDTYGRVYDVYGVGDYTAGLYKVSSRSNVKYLVPLITAYDKTTATASDIISGKTAYDSNGNYMTGTAYSPLSIGSEEEMEALLSAVNENQNPYNQHITTVKYTGSSTDKYSAQKLYTLYIAYDSTTGKYICHWSPTFTLCGWMTDNSYRPSGDIVLPSAYSSIVRGAFAFNNNITSVDFQRTGHLNIYGYAFYYCTQLEKVIIRSDSVATGSDTMFDNTAITGYPVFSSTSTPTGYIYVQDALLEDYKVASGWSKYADRIKPLSEYVEE